jgi:serine/threonine-protein kinase
MAPEQARGGNTIDHRCDVYALGAMLYRAVTGRPAFSGEDAGRTLTSVIWDEPARPKTLRKDLPDSLELVIQRAMAKDPTGRFGSMADLDSALIPFEFVESGASTRMPAPKTPPPPTTPRAGGNDLGRAQTMVASTTSKSAAPDMTIARWARPRVVAYGLLSMAWALVVSGSLIGYSIMQVTHHVLASVEQWLVLALAVAVTAPLVIMEVRRLVRGAWRNTATMLMHADVMARASGWSLAVYAAGSGPLRFWALLRHEALPLVTELGAVLASLIAACVVLWRARRR